MKHVNKTVNDSCHVNVIVLLKMGEKRGNIQSVMAIHNIIHIIYIHVNKNDNFFLHQLDIKKRIK